MMKWKPGLGALVAVALLAACGDDGGGTSSADSVEQFVKERDTQIDTICDCFDELGFDSPSMCRNAQVPIGPSMKDCTKDAFGDDEASSVNYLDCVMPLERNFSACLDDRLMCRNAADDGLGPCVADYNVGLQKCIELPTAVRRDLMSCDITLALTAIVLGPGLVGGGDGACSDTCIFFDDGECDDGGPGAAFMDCDLGTDCSDCGPR